MAKEVNVEQIRNLNNKVYLGGMLAELDKSQIRKGVGSDGVKYISFKGAIQCHPDDAAYTAYFSAFIKQMTKKGTESETYKKAIRWLEDAVPMTKDRNNPTFVNMQGSVSWNGYVAADGQFKETFINGIQFINDFTEYRYDMDIEGYIEGIEDEQDDEGEDTGRKLVKLVSKDFFQNALVFEKKNRLIADKDIADAFEDADYEVGRTVSISCSRDKSSAKPKVKPGGFGKQPVTSGSTPMVWKIVGGDPAIDEDSKDALTKEQIKALKNALKARCDEIIENGYQGKSDKKSSKGSKGGFGKKNEDTSGFSEVEDDDDEPF